jgi:hypothetical protein
VLPFEDGGAAVSLVASHTVVDGLGFVQATTEAAVGRTRHLGYPLPGSSPRRRAILEDGRQTVAAAPELARALAATVRVARSKRKHVAAALASAPPPPRRSATDGTVQVPTVTAYLDLTEWDARANSLGGNGHTLLAGFAGRLGARMGRVCADGTVTLSLPISDRIEGDTRGNAMVLPIASVDPTRLSSDLSEARIKAKQAFADLAQSSDQLLASMPLTSMTPRWVARRAAGVGLGTADLPIGCSNIGDLDPAMNRPDGTDADYASGRLIEPGISRRVLERMGGQLFVVSGRLHGRVWISVNAYLFDRANSPDALRGDVIATLAEFDLAAEIHG